MSKPGQSREGRKEAPQIDSADVRRPYTTMHTFIQACRTVWAYRRRRVWRHSIPLLKASTVGYSSTRRCSSIMVRMRACACTCSCRTPQCSPSANQLRSPQLLCTLICGPIDPSHQLIQPCPTPPTQAAATAAAAAAASQGRRRVLLFDLDGTLYPNGNGYRKHIIGRLFEYMHEHLGVPRSTPAESIWRPLFDKYHQSERGFRAEGYQFDHVHCELIWSMVLYRVSP